MIEIMQGIVITLFGGCFLFYILAFMFKSLFGKEYDQVKEALIERIKSTPQPKPPEGKILI